MLCMKPLQMRGYQGGLPLIDSELIARTAVIVPLAPVITSSFTSKLLGNVPVPPGLVTSRPFRLVITKLPVIPPDTVPLKPLLRISEAVEAAVAVMGGAINCSKVSPVVTEKGRMASRGPWPEKEKVRGVKSQVTAGCR